MTWSGWDIAVILVGILQVVGVVYVARAALKIVNGPVAWGRKRVVPFIDHGKNLPRVGREAWEANREQALALYDEARDTVQAVRETVSPPAFAASEPINYRSLGTAWTSLQAARQALGFVRRAGKRKNAPASAPFAERIGLIPSARKPLPKLIGAARFVLRVRGLLRKSGIV